MNRPDDLARGVQTARGGPVAGDLSKERARAGGCLGHVRQILIDVNMLIRVLR
jgi:hypothetical protein